MRMLNNDPGTVAGNTKLLKKAFSAANKFSEAQSFRKEEIGKFTKRFGNDTHAPIKHYLKSSLLDFINAM